MTIFVTSDLHFGHANIIKYAQKTRGRFANIKEMDDYIIDTWNSTVKYNDIVYILGDFIFGSQQRAVEVASSLNGRKILIKGNHDVKVTKSKEFCGEFEGIYSYYHLYYEKKNIIMFHYPILSWDRQRYGAIHLYGHLHGNPSGIEQYRAMDVGFDATGQVVMKLEDVILRIENNAIPQ